VSKLLCGADLENLERVGSIYRVDSCVGEAIDFDFIFFDGLKITVHVPAKKLCHDRVGKFVSTNISNDRWLFAVGDFRSFKDCVKHRI
jgi:hypothetical protein